MLPAGEMWSVVTLSPKMPSGARAFDFGDLPGCKPKFVKNGGSWM